MQGTYFHFVLTELDSFFSNFSCIGLKEKSLIKEFLD